MNEAGMKTENIVTLTMNPAIDTSVTVERIVTDHKIRCLKTRRDPGGGGINVARTLKRFGAEPLAIFPMGGPSGHMLVHLVQAEGVRHQSFGIEHDCRANFTANEIETNAQYRFVLPGPTLNEEEWNAGLGLMTRRRRAAMRWRAAACRAACRSISMHGWRAT
jgi:6-phosphofructokinase 2